MIKRYISIMLAIIIALFSLSACGSDTTTKNNTKETLKIVVTIFPEYDWIREILGDEFGQADVTMLLDNSVDLHSYQPTADDILKISSCDLFIYVGGESDEWVEDTLQEAVNPDMQIINLLDILDDKVKEEEIIEGMESEDEAGDENESEYDEHVWLSLKNTQILVTSIANTLAQLDEENADIYQTNADSYNQKLADLDVRYQAAVDAGTHKTLLFGDRFPFRYLADDYNLSYYAAFSGCSAETEASFETIVFLSEKVDELGLHTILTIDGSDQKIAQTIISNTTGKNQQILVMDSLQSITSSDVENGVSYLSVMENNLTVLTEALR